MQAWDNPRRYCGNSELLKIIISLSKNRHLFWLFNYFFWEENYSWLGLAPVSKKVKIIILNLDSSLKEKDTQKIGLEELTWLNDVLILFFEEFLAVFGRMDLQRQ